MAENSRVIYCYSDEFLKYDYGDDHPLKVYRLKLTYELSKSYDLFKNITVIEPEYCSEEDILKVHSSHYLYVLKQCNNGLCPPEAFFYNLDTSDNPVFEGVYDWSTLVCGSSLKGAKSLLSGVCDTFFSISGGLHHAMPEKASGFCYLNDIAVAIKYLIDNGKKVLYIDTDAHHGDGVEKIFYETSKVMTISFHESGRFLFPGTGFETDIGAGDGLGYAVNFPLYPYTDDKNFLRGFFEIVPTLIEAFKPDIIVTQLGVDCFYNDPLATLNLTTISFEKIIKFYKELGIPWLALGGGGYNPANVARAWTLALAIMADKEISDPIPDSFTDIALPYKVKINKLRDTESIKDEEYSNLIDRETSRVIEKLKKHLFPYHHL
ncbi:MAG: acetoin utilization protein AcuC [Proteobacteria bacterium]|nr:acetoin utilization protein AcuC [Pseudomonadota bacterium]